MTIVLPLGFQLVRPFQQRMDAGKAKEATSHAVQIHHGPRPYQNNVEKRPAAANASHSPTTHSQAHGWRETGLGGAARSKDRSSFKNILALPAPDGAEKARFLYKQSRSVFAANRSTDLTICF